MFEHDCQPTRFTIMLTRGAILSEDISFVAPSANWWVVKIPKRLNLTGVKTEDGEPRQGVESG